MLRVYQQLNQEAEYVLYKQNTLMLLYHSHKWELLDTGCQVPKSMTELAANSYNSGTDFRSIAQWSSNTRAAYFTYRLSKLYDTLCKFENLTLTVPVNDRESLFIACLTIQDFARGKNVTFEPLRNARHICSSLDQFRCCLDFRCRSIIFEGIPEPVSTPVAKVVTGTTDIGDSFRIWSELMNEVITPMLLLDSSFEPTHKYKIRALNEALFEQDTTSLHELRTTLLADVSSKYEELVARKQNVFDKDLIWILNPEESS